MSAYIDACRGRFGVEPICSVLGVSASAYYQRKTGARSQRVVADERLLALIRELHLANYEAYGSRKTWLALRRAGHEVGRDHVARLDEIRQPPHKLGLGRLPALGAALGAPDPSLAHPARRSTSTAG